MNPRRWSRTIPSPRGNARHRPIPKGLRPPAQGCEERATLGHDSQMEINHNGVVTKLVRLASRRICRNRVAVVPILPRSPKVGAAPTLGWRPQSLWDCSRPNAIRFHHTAMRSRSPRIPTGFRPKAQGCEARATLGKRPKKITTPTGLWPFSHARQTKTNCRNRVAVGNVC